MGYVVRLFHSILVPLIQSVFRSSILLSYPSVDVMLCIVSEINPLENTFVKNPKRKHDTIYPVSTSFNESKRWITYRTPAVKELYSKVGVIFVDTLDNAEGVSFYENAPHIDELPSGTIH